MKDVKGKVAVITGGARGMGLLWAEKLLHDGAFVILIDKDSAALKAAMAQIKKTFPKHIAVYQLDITNKKKVVTIFKSIESRYKSIDILINNAGIVAGGKFTDVSIDLHEATIDINLKSAIYTTKAVLTGMIKRKEGHIINIASAAGFIGTPYMAPYNASKWGIIGFTESLKLEMEELNLKNIHFTLVCPSYVKTGMFQGVKAPLLIPLLEPQKIIEKAYRAFRNNKYLVMEPFIVKFIPLLRGILSNRGFNIVAKILGVTRSMKSWTGRK